MAEKKLKGSVPEPFDFWSVQVNYHAIAGWLSAGSDGSILAFDFYEA
jgi:hypothetical protein